MDLHDLRNGERVRTVNGSIAEIISETEDGHWIRVRYVESESDEALVGTEDLCSADEIEGPIANPPSGG